MVDEESYERIKPLPNLDYKIVCGNSLIGVDSREEIADYQGDMLTYQPLEELKRLQAQHFEETNSARKAELDKEIKQIIKALTGSEDTFDFRIYFSNVFKAQQGFDVVIGNPPYVRQEQIKALKETLKQQYECYTGTADLYVFFYEKGVNLLRAGGVLAYISSNKYFRAGYGKKLRKFLAEQTRIRDVIDFGDAPVFAAIAYPTIAIVKRADADSEAIEKRQFQALVWEEGQPLTNFNETVVAKSFEMPQSALEETGWQFIDAASLDLLARLRRAGTPLGEYVKNRFYRSILTGFNEAFVISRETRDRLIAEHPSSAKLLMPFLRGRDIKRWVVDYQDLWIVFTRRGIDIEKYPAILKYLSQFKERLTPGISGGRKAGSYEWYEIQDNVAYWQEFSQSKIIYPDIYEHQSFTIDEDNFFLGNTCYFIPTDESWLCGLLNSRIVEWFYSNTSSRVRGGYLRAFSTYIKQIPIPPASEVDKATLTTLVQNCLNAKGQNVSHWEAESDRIVARLYGLTPEDLAIISKS